MNGRIKGKSPLGMVDLLLRHNPDASDEQLADVVSEWGHLLDEQYVVGDDFEPGEDASDVADRHI
jgi:hypothetical protein